MSGLHHYVMRCAVCVLEWVDSTTMGCGVWCVYTRMSGLHQYVMWCVVCSVLSVYYMHYGWTAPLCDVVCSVYVYTRMSGLHHYVMWCVVCVY